jgi:hypothetical protein
VKQGDGCAYLKHLMLCESIGIHTVILAVNIPVPLHSTFDLLVRH